MERFYTMTDACDFTKDMKIVKFNGSNDEWPRWSKKFMSVAKIKKFSHVIDGSVEVLSFSNDMQTAQKMIRETNHVVYCCLMLCMNENNCLNLVDTAKTVNLPGGNASLEYLPNLNSKFFMKCFEECLICCTWN